MKKVFAHVDADCFYVSCERVRDPSLRGRPVGVLGNQGACVIARSYEMKAAGVHVAMPIWEAKRICPEAIFVKRDFAWYEAVCRATQDILKQYSDVVEFYSIDESFMDLTGFDYDQESLAKEIQNRVMKELQVPVSIGIGNTRLLAKIGSDKNKPFGVTIVNQDNAKAFLKTTPVAEISGVGRRLERRLHQVGIYSCWDYVQTPREQIKYLLHKPGEQIWYELQGKSLMPIRPVRPQRKVVSRGGQIPGYSSDKKTVYGFLIRNLERLCEALWRYQVEVGNLNVIFQESRGKYKSSPQALPDFTADFERLFEAAQHSFKKLFLPGTSYGAMHLVGTPVRSKFEKQLNLFEHADPRQKRFIEVKQELNARFGSFTARSASTAAIPEIFRDTGSDHEICDIDGKFCF